MNGQFKGKVRRILKTVPIAPTLLTLGNLTCGFAALVYITKAYGLTSGDEVDKIRYFSLACWCILVAMVFDSLDGTVARLTRTTGEFGKQMDSLADVVSFGVAPAFIVKVLCSYFYSDSGDVINNMISFLTGVFVVCAALRLARYNVEFESKDKSGFDGIPSPAAAGAAVTICLITLDRHLTDFKVDYLISFLPFYMLLLGGLMVSRVRYPHLIKSYLRGKRTLWQIFALVLVVAVHFLYLELMLTITFNLFVFSGLLLAGVGLFRKKEPTPAIAPVDDQTEASNDKR